MSRMRLKADDIRVFTDAATAFFTQSTRKPAAVRTAYLMERPERVIWNDFQGLIELGGKWRGSVTFSAPRGLLTHVLLLMGERDYSEASHRDIIGEIANQMSGYARRHFGDGMDISPPKLLTDRRLVATSGAPVVIPMNWDCYEAHLVVDMLPAV